MTRRLHYSPRYLDPWSRVRFWLRCPTCGGRFGRHDLSDFTGGAGDVVRYRFPHNDQLAAETDEVGRMFADPLGFFERQARADHDRGTSG